ncbi:tRNA lysidine(34) synthetase TilS [Pandoraea terrae]
MRVAVALSGGLDSMALLDALAQCAALDASIQAFAFHVHHGLAAAANDWLRCCAREAETRGVTFDARHVDVPRNARQGIEGAARAARYTALAGMAEAHGVHLLLTAHHADDQAETVLLQLLRGAGLPGVAAMPALGAMPGQGAGGRMMARPWIGVSRATLQAYAEVRGLTWVDDPSNTDTRHLRNGLRHDVMPALARHVPGYRDTLGRFARHAAQAQGLLDQLAAIDWAAADLGDGRLSRTVVQALDADRVANLLRYWVARVGLPMPSEARLDEWVKQVREAAADASLTLPHGEGVLRLYRGALQWTRVFAADDAPADATLQWRGELEWRLPAWHGRIGFAPAAPGESGIEESILRAHRLVARARGGGERLRLRVDGHSRSLKHWFQAMGVPVWRRQVPVVWLDDRLLFVPHLGLDAAWLAADDAVSPPAASREIQWMLTWHDDAGFGARGG